MLKNSAFTYGHVAKFFHWLMAILFVAMFVVAYIMINMSRSALMFSLYDLHKATGLLLFALFTLRLAWRLLNVQPVLSESIPSWQKRMAKSNVFLLYVLMFAMPITGFLTSTLGGHDISFYKIFIFPALAHSRSASLFFSMAHEYLSYLLIIAFTLHIMGAGYHHYFLKDNVFARMWR